MNSEDLDFPYENPPFVAIGVASFDIKTGIKVNYQWNFPENDLLKNSELTIDDIFKIHLCNVHRQDESFFQDFKVSKLEYPRFGVFMISSIFFLKLTPRNAHISLGFILKESDIKNNLFFNSFLNSKIKSLSNILRKCLQESKPYSSITSYVKKCSIDISKVIFCMNKINFIEKHNLKINVEEKQHPNSYSDPSSISKSIEKTNLRRLNSNDFTNYNLLSENDIQFNFSELEFSFLALLLTSHIQTQMTTVVECQNIKYDRTIAMFLDRFLLPSQREMSSFEIRESPVPGLFLQFVHQQKTLRNKMMTMINRPTTWVRFSDQSIDQIIPSPNNHINTSNNFTYDNLVSVKTPAPWVCKTIQLVQQAPASMQKNICDIQMKDILWSASSYSIIAQSTPQTQTQLLKPWTWSIFNEKSTGFPIITLGSSSLSNEEDFKLIASVSQLFYPDQILSKYI